VLNGRYLVPFNCRTRLDLISIIYTLIIVIIIIIIIIVYTYLYHHRDNFKGGRKTGHDVTH